MMLEAVITTPTPISETKDCPYCHRQIPATVTFCWYCARELVARPERPDTTPPARRFPLGIVLLVTAVIILIAFIILSNPR